MVFSHRSLSRWWLLLGTAALAVSGLFSIVIVLARTPPFASVPAFRSLFHQALVVHVDLSVLAWFLCIACLTLSRAATHHGVAERGALLCFAFGMLAIAASPLFPNAEPLMSNYIPVLMNPVFFLGLSLIFCGCAIMTALFLPSRDVAATAAIMGISLAAFAWSYAQMPREVTGQQYYEMLFWGGGHVLQLLHVQVMLSCWLALAMACGVTPRRGAPLTCVMLIGPLAACLVPAAYLLFEVTSQAHRQFFTGLMVAVNGIGPVLLALLLAVPLLKAHPQRRLRALYSALTVSILLFLYGGALGMMIRGQNVTIPAHYHGSIVGVTLAFMGFAYLMLPGFGYAPAAHTRLAFWQPIVYGGGQFLHITGLAWSGGYGVLRKTPGALEGGFTAAKAAMGMMGGGGLLAIIGGLMFVVAVVRSVAARPASAGG